MFQRFILIVVVTVVSSFACTTIARADDHDPKGTWRIINYWSVTCAPCRVEIPELNVLSKELAAVNVSVVGVNFDDDDRGRTLKLASLMGIEFPTLTLEKVKALKLTPPYVLPTTYILSPDNQVMAKLIGAQDREMIKTKMRELFAME